jgi:hypothetical protein
MVTINYDVLNPNYKESYKAVLSQGRVFASGDVVKDFADAVKHDMEHTKLDFVLYSSTVDNFVIDVIGFQFAGGMIVKEETQDMEQPAVYDSMETWLEILNHFAARDFNGHMTIMAFTTGWKVMLDTPELSREGREHLNSLPSFQSLEEALRACALHHARKPPTK